jgi:Carboxypeptidase regulatory-like domain/TonB-dependent Receptor Plug Domain
MKRIVGLALALALGLLPSAFAQGAKGSIYGKVVDESGAVMPGATVTLKGANIGAMTTSASAQGDFRFLNLDSGTYKMTVALTGFGTQNRDVNVNAGVNVDLRFHLKVAAVEETITVSSETPVVDTKKSGTSTTLTQEELEGIPNSRDPWAVLRTIPGVLVDRLNIAGSESGQQSYFIGKGSVQADTQWTLDGVVINDAGAAGASPTYFDYDAFDQINVTTGGTDVKMATGGLGLNFVTKRGTNSFHGSIGGYLAHDELQSGNVPDELVGDSRLQGSDKADHTDQIADYGADFGGPIVKDKLWFFGSYGKQDIRVRRLNQTRDKTLLKDYTGKVNWQATSSDMISLLYFNGQKLKYGRAVGGAPATQEDSFLRDQGNAGAHPLYGIQNLEWNHIFNPNLFANLRLSRQNTGFNLTPRGGVDQDERRDLVANVASGSSDYFASVRPQTSVNADFNYFRSGLGGNHELKFGFGYRRATVSSSTVPSGNQIRALISRTLGPQAVVRRASISAYQGRYSGFYLGDTFTRERLTLNLGLRYDRQTSTNKPTTAPANASLPEILPELAYDGSGQGIKWTDFSPRVGLTYALGEDRKTVIRASYARYPSYLTMSDTSIDNPIGGLGTLQYGWNDVNCDQFAQANEVNLAGGLTQPPLNASLEAVNRIDPDFSAPTDNELILGFEHEVAPNLSLGVTGTYRRSSKSIYFPFLGVNGTGWVSQDPISVDTDEGRYTITPYDLTPDNLAGAEANGFGQYLTNRPGYGRHFKGLELTAHKRLSNKWMARLAFSYNDWTEHFDGREGIQNPNPVLYDTYGYSLFGQTILTDALKDGGQLAYFGIGSGKTYWINAKWQLNVSALYQLPAGFEIAGNLFGRQGYPRITTIDFETGLGTFSGIATPELDQVRTPNVWNLDFRLAKNIRLSGRASLNLTADLFNVFNANTVLVRTGNADGAFNRINEIQAPRIVRFGMRLGF